MRDSKPRRLVQQQMYARERRGIFRATEGYDTIAKSRGLDPSFVKKTLHPYCVYDAPSELSGRGEKDESLYPETIHLLHLENGDTVLGRSIYQAADFTGLRSAFFTHNYVMPDAGDPQEYREWLGASFEDTYNLEDGAELAELSELPQQPSSSVQPSSRSILALMNIGEKPFKQLLYAVITAISGKKKLYVALDAPITQLSAQAKQLLRVLYASLPYAYRKQLGFITYAKEPQSRKGIHLTFVEKGSLRPGDRATEKDFTFDFANGRFTNVDIELADQPYLNFAWEQLERPAQADSFFTFADHMLTGLETERQLAASSYHELSVLFQIEAGEESLYQQHKPAVLRSLLDYLKSTGTVDEKMRLNDLFLARFDHEFDRVRQGALPEPYVIDAFMEYYQLDGRYLEGKLVSLFILALNQANKQGNQGAVATIYTAVESSPALSQAFFAKLMADSRFADSLLMPFLEKQFKAAAGAKSIVELLERWTDMYPGLAGYDPFQTIVREQLAAKLGLERYSLSAVNRTLEQLHAISAARRSSKGRSGIDHDWDLLVESIELAVYREMLAVLELNRLTRDQLQHAAFLMDKDQMRWMNDRLDDSRLQSTSRKLQAVYQIVMLPEPTTALLDDLSSEEVEQVQLAVRSLLEGGLELADAPRAVIAFVGSDNTDVVDYAALLEFVRRKSADKEGMYRFFHWSQKQPAFMRPRGFVPAYAAAIVSYFKKHDRDAFRNRSNRKQYFAKAGPVLAAVYKQAERELTSALGRLLRGGKGRLFLSIAVLGIILVGAGVVLSLGGEKDGNTDVIEQPRASPTATPDPRPAVLVYAVRDAASVGEESATSLVFLFHDAAACAQLNPSSLRIQSPGAEESVYTDLAFQPDCDELGGEATPTAADLTTGLPDQTSTSTNTTQTENVDPSTAADQTEDAVTPTLAAQTDGDIVTTTMQPGNADMSSATPQSESTDDLPDSAGSEAPIGETDAAFDPSFYPGKVFVSLGKQVELSVGSIISVNGAEYVLSAAPLEIN